MQSAGVGEVESDRQCWKWSQCIKCKEEGREEERESGTKWDELSLKIYCSHCKLRTERTLKIGTHFLISFLPFGGRSTAVKISKQNRNRNKNFELSTPFAVASRAVCANVCV